MFFILSKVLAFLISPFTWIIIGVLYGIFTKVATRKKKAFVFSIVVFFIFSNEFLAEEAMRQLEYPDKKLSTKDHFDVAIVLGGMIKYDGKNEKLIFNGNIDRLLQAIVLQRKGIVDKILISGGSGDIGYPDVAEAKLLLNFCIEMGFDSTAIWIESESRNTAQNAQLSYTLMKTKFPHPEQKSYLIITSASHMKRAMACFSATGLPVTDYSTGRIAGPRRLDIQNMLIPNIWAMAIWESVLHESIGYAAYQINGYL